MCLSNKSLTNFFSSSSVSALLVVLAAVLSTAGAADCVGVVANEAFKPGDFERCAAITVGDASRGVRVHVFWTILGRGTKDEEITLAAQFPSDRGWVAIGLSESGSMYGSDIFVVRKPTGGIAVAEVSVSSLDLTQTHTHIYTLTHTHTHNTHTHTHKHPQTPTHTHTHARSLCWAPLTPALAGQLMRKARPRSTAFLATCRNSLVSVSCFVYVILHRIGSRGAQLPRPSMQSRT